MAMAPINWSSIHFEPRPFLVLLAAFMCQMINEGFMFGGDLLPPYLVEFFKVSTGEIMLLFSLLHAPQCLLGPISSWLTNKFGARAVIIVFTFIGACAIVVSTFCHRYWLFLTWSTLAGVALGLTSVPRVTCVSFHYSPEWRHFATSFATVGGSIGAATFPFIYQILLSYFSWQITLTILSGVLLQCVVFGALIGPTPKNVQLEDDDKDQNDERVLRKNSAKSPRNCPLLSRMAFYAYVFHSVCWSMAEWADCMFALWMTNENYDQVQVATLITVFTGSSVLGKTSASFIVLIFKDHLMFFSAFFVLIMGITNICAAHCYSFYGFIAVKLVMGYVFGAVLGMMPSIVLQLVGIREFNTSMGRLNFLFGISGLISPPTAGLIVDATKSYRFVYKVMFCLVLVSVGSMLPFIYPCNQLVLRLPWCRRSLKRRQSIVFAKLSTITDARNAAAGEQTTSLAANTTDSTAKLLSNDTYSSLCDINNTNMQSQQGGSNRSYTAKKSSTGGETNSLAVPMLDLDQIYAPTTVNSKGHEIKLTDSYREATFLGDLDD